MSVAYAQKPTPSAADWAARLLDKGYCIVPDLMPKTKVAALAADLDERFDKTPFCQGAFYGSRTKRFGGLLKRSPLAADFVMHDTIHEIVRTALGPFCDWYQLNLAQGLGIWPGEPEQVPHRDQDMWGGVKGQTEYLVNVMWPFTPFRKENGATLIWPDSHRCQHTFILDREDAVYAEMDPGSALLFLGSTLHGAGANRTSKPRTGIVVGYSLGWLRPHEAQWLVYPPEVARNFPPEVTELIGYRQHRPNLGNYEGQCPSVLLKGPVPDYLQAQDDLRPDQAREITAFRERQRNAQD
jgi:ectoine hydroxylase-related dioxygenase (phytanoyl-CoA dioxygenase family)